VNLREGESEKVVKWDGELAPEKETGKGREMQVGDHE
jgi:hypothetical protein